MPAIVIIIVLTTWIVVLYDSRHDPRWIFIEVYDHSQRSFLCRRAVVSLLRCGPRSPQRSVTEQPLLLDYAATLAYPSWEIHTDPSRCDLKFGGIASSMR
jgi:hypothetical protein